MSNTIGWGKGASNNSIGWGNVGTNGFGSIYSSSNSGETDLAGLTSPSASFKQRVLDDLGTFEAQQCLDDLINQGLFDNANFVLTPNGYKAGKLYALKPENGDLDVTWVRNGNATRFNASGLIESVGNNVPRLDYLNGNCPSILVEEQSTNLLKFSEDFSSTFWEGNVINNAGNSPDGLNNSTKILSGDDIYNFTNYTNDIYSFSVFAKSEDVNRNITLRLRSKVGRNLDATFDIFNGSLISTTGSNSFLETKIDVIGNFFRITLTGKPISSEIWSQTRIFSNGNDNADGVLIWGSQFELLNKSSSYVSTNGSSVTRPADAPQPITPPTGTTEIVEVFENGTTNTITTIPASYTIPFGRFKYILFN